MWFQESQKQREMVEQRYAKYKEIVGNLQHQLEESKKRIQEYRVWTLEWRGPQSRSIFLLCKVRSWLSNLIDWSLAVNFRMRSWMQPVGVSILLVWHHLCSVRAISWPIPLCLPTPVSTGVWELQLKVVEIIFWDCWAKKNESLFWIWCK